MGAVRAQKEAHFTDHLKDQVIAKFRTSCIRFISSRFLKFVPLSANPEASVLVAVPAAVIEETTATLAEEKEDGSAIFSLFMMIGYDQKFPTLIGLWDHLPLGSPAVKLDLRQHPRGPIPDE